MKTLANSAIRLAGYIAVFPALSAAMTEQEYEQNIKQINARYQLVYDNAQKEGDDIKKESRSCLIEMSFDADWEITKVSFDVPEVQFKNREFSFHTVKTTFSNKVIAKTKVPKTYFENKNIGFGIKTKVPVIRWEIEEISTKVPEFKWDETSFRTKIPEFYSKRIEWKFHILKLKKLKELNIPCKEQEKRANELSARVQSTADTHKKEIDKVTAEFLVAKAEELVAEMTAAELEFNKGINSMDTAIAEMKSNGVDPNTFLVEYDDQKVTMIQARALLIQQKSDALTAMRVSHEQIVNSITSLARA